MSLSVFPACSEKSASVIVVLELKLRQLMCGKNQSYRHLEIATAMMANGDSTAMK
jgi:hypothetical protein